jgi:hypothetical protein
MLLRTIAATLVVLTGAGISLLPAFAIEGYPETKCSFNADKSSIALTVSNSGAGNYACTASCQYTIAGQRPLQTLSCNYNLSANTAEKVVCDVDGKGPNYFAEIRPVRSVCQPR